MPVYYLNSDHCGAFQAVSSACNRMKEILVLSELVAAEPDNYPADYPTNLTELCNKRVAELCRMANRKAMEEGILDFVWNELDTAPVQSLLSELESEAKMSNGRWYYQLADYWNEVELPAPVETLLDAYTNALSSVCPGLLRTDRNCPVPAGAYALSCAGFSNYYFIFENEAAVDAFAADAHLFDGVLQMNWEISSWFDT